jgi:hypothetical protein
MTLLSVFICTLKYTVNRVSSLAELINHEYYLTTYINCQNMNKLNIIEKVYHKIGITTLPFGHPSKGGESEQRSILQLYISNFLSFIWRLVDSPPLEGCPKGRVVVALPDSYVFAFNIRILQCTDEDYKKRHYKYITRAK